MYTPQKYRPVSRKRMNSPSQRGLVRHDLGLGEVDGLFNIGKMFTRMFTFRPSSFKLKNIMGAFGSVTTAVATGGIAPILSEFAGPSGLKLTKGTLTSAHSSLMPLVGYGALAIGAVAGGVTLLPAGALTGGAGVAIGTPAAGSTEIAAALAPSAGGGFFSAVGSGLSTVGSGLMTAMKALPFIGQVLGGGSGGQPQQQAGGMTQAEYDVQQQAAYNQQQAQAAYDAQVRVQQEQMYQPGAMPVSYDMGQPSMTGMNASYGDLRSPYTAIAEDGSTVQVDPATGQVIPEGISMPMIIGIGGIAALTGWYFLTPDSKSNN